MKSILRGFGAAFAGFAMIAVLVFSVLCLIQAGFLGGYLAISVFIGSVTLLVTDVLLLHMIGKGGKYAAGNVRS